MERATLVRELIRGFRILFYVCLSYHATHTKKAELGLTRGELDLGMLHTDVTFDGPNELFLKVLCRA